MLPTQAPLCPMVQLEITKPNFLLSKSRQMLTRSFIFSLFTRHWLISFSLVLGYFSLHGEVTLNFSNIGTSMQIANSAGIGWYSTGNSFRESELPINLEQARRVQLGFPTSGWESEYAGTTWKLSPWLGTYEPTSAPWVYHETLGWIYFHQADLNSIWIWKDELGWVWTNQDVFPYLYQTLPDGWLALNPKSSRPALVFDFPTNTWFKIEKPTINLSITPIPSNGGTIDGLREINTGGNLAVLARPNIGFVFSKWEGTYNTNENPLLVDELKKSISLNAIFSPINQVINSPEMDLILGHLSSQSDRQKALLELGLNGYSSLVSNPLDPNSFNSELEFFIHATGAQTSQQPALIFNSESALITHPFAPMKVGSESEVYLEGSMRGIIKHRVISIESVHTVQSVKVELVFPNKEIEIRWFAQDVEGNVWLVKSTKNDVSKSNPFIILNKEISKGWKSWYDSSLIPSSYTIHSSYPVDIYAQGIGTFKNCVEALIFREPDFQNEYYAPGYGLIKISTP